METYKITGMSCAACVNHVEKAALSVNGCRSAAASLTAGTLTVNGGDSEKIIKSVEKAGYGCSLMKNGEKPDFDNRAEIKRIFYRLVFSVVLLIPLMYLSMGKMAGLNPPVGELSAFLQLGICLASLIINAKYFSSGVRGLIHRSPNMDTLVAVGSGASFIYSAVIVTSALISGNLPLYNIDSSFPHLYFESAAMIPAFVSFGKLLEAMARRKTASVISSLEKLVPEVASVIKDGKETKVAVCDIKKGELVTVRAGEVIPLDGIVTDGCASVDESSLTGENIPVFKSTGDTVKAGCINVNGVITFEVTAESGDTSLAKITELVSGATSSKAPVGRLSDKVASIFVPTVMGIALVTAVIWFIITKEISVALTRGVSVLVVSCPCALGLATPVAITVGCGIGAKHGILFRSAEALENLGKTKIAVFDKTGTLTEGKPTVCGIYGKDILFVAHSLERLSVHPLALSVTEYCIDNGIGYGEVTDFSEAPGKGLSGVINGIRYYACGIKNLPDEISEKAKSLMSGKSSEAETPLVFYGEDGNVGIITVKDRVKPDSAEAVRRLRNMSVETVLLSGDGSEAPGAVAKELRIGKVFGGIPPDGKAGIIAGLKKDGFTVMAGDGINDAPALASADIGAAMAGGTDIAAQSSDILLMGNSPYDLASGISLSRQTLRIIKQNLFWAFCYNIVGIPLAAGVFSPLGIELAPAFCSAAMSFSSLFVVSNALRLNLYDIKKDYKIIAHSGKKEKNKMAQVTVEIKGMMCEHCEMRVKNAIEDLPCVVSAVVSAEEGKAVITTSRTPNMTKIYKCIENVGYDVVKPQ